MQDTGWQLHKRKLNCHKKSPFLTGFLLLAGVCITLMAIKDIANKGDEFKSASLDGQR
jgi:uncharacterized membrane protein